MPYHTKPKDNTYLTVSDEGKILGKHPTKKRSQAQATAVTIAEGLVPGLTPKKRPKKKRRVP